MKIYFFCLNCLIFLFWGCKSENFHIEEIADQRCVVKCDSCKGIEYKKNNMYRKFSILNEFIKNYSYAESSNFSLNDSLYFYRDYKNDFAYMLNFSKNKLYRSKDRKIIALNDSKKNNIDSLLKKIDFYHLAEIKKLQNSEKENNISFFQSAFFFGWINKRTIFFSQDLLNINEFIQLKLILDTL